MTIAEKLAYIYYTCEEWHRSKLGYKEAIEYHDRFIRSGNIKYIEVEDCLLGYIEVWFINQFQLDRINNKEPFFNYDEDLLSGDIIYVANIWINNNFRNGVVFKIFINQLKEIKSNYRLVVWHRNNEVYKQIELT